MKFGYFCNTTNWNHKPYNQLLDETKEITTFCDSEIPCRVSSDPHERRNDLDTVSERDSAK